MKAQLVDLICKRLGHDEAALREQFAHSQVLVEVRHLAIDELLLDKIARRVHDSACPNYRRLHLPTSWHSVSPAKADRVHSCVSNEYFSPMSPTGRDYFNITALSTRPEQKLLLSAVAWADGRLRSAVRRSVPRGLRRKDVYEGPR